jgi:hypothetical protein
MMTSILESIEESHYNIVPLATGDTLNKIADLHGLKRKSYVFGIFHERDKSFRDRILKFIKDTKARPVNALEQDLRY